MIPNDQLPTALRVTEWVGTPLPRHIAYRAASALETAWTELREIREAIGADPEESTADEVRRYVDRQERHITNSLNEAARWQTHVLNIREAAGLQSVMLNDLPDVIGHIVAERDSHSDRADDLANLLYMIAEALNVPQEPHQTFSDRLLEAIENAAGHDHDRTGTTPAISHAPGCGRWGPKHYECLRREYDVLAAELDHLQQAATGGLTAPGNWLGANPAREEGRDAPPFEGREKKGSVSEHEKRLRGITRWFGVFPNADDQRDARICIESADEINRLRRENTELRRKNQLLREALARQHGEVGEVDGEAKIQHQIRVAATLFHPGVQVSIVQGAIDRLYERFEHLRRTYEPTGFDFGATIEDVVSAGDDDAAAARLDEAMRKADQARCRGGDWPGDHGEPTGREGR